VSCFLEDHGGWLARLAMSVNGVLFACSVPLSFFFLLTRFKVHYLHVRSVLLIFACRSESVVTLKVHVEAVSEIPILPHKHRAVQ
jgi:hypothetical protein